MSDETQDVRNILLEFSESFPTAPVLPSARTLEGRRSRYSRGYRALWIGSALMLMANVAVISLLGSRPATEKITNVIQFCAPLIAAAVCLRHFLRDHRQAESRPNSWPWLYFGLASFSWALGQGVWTWYSLWDRAHALFPSIGDIGFCLAIPLFAAGLLTMPTAPRTTSGRIKEVMDGLVVGLTLLVVAWLPALQPMLKGSDSSLAGALTITYPFGDLVLGSIILAAVVNNRHQGVAQFRLVSWAVFALAVSDFFFPYIVLIHLNYTSANYSDMGWTSAFLLIALAGTHPARMQGSTSAKVKLSLTRLALPYIASTLSIVVVILQCTKIPGGIESIIPKGAVILALIIFRYLAASAENRKLRVIAASVVANNADLSIIQNFAGLVILHEGLLADSWGETNATKAARDQFLEAVERMSKRGQVNDKLLATLEDKIPTNPSSRELANLGIGRGR